ncbi:MAG TPA: LacI family DNA-binding transcriptional regulator [Limnochordia bacterium]
MDSPQEPVTMLDVARLAGVSKATVSRALRNDPRVSPATRQRIAAIARRLRYQPHRIASALATQRTNALGLVIPSPPRSFSHPFYLEFIGGVGDRALEEGYTFFFARGEDMFTPDDRGRLALTPIAARADGLILTEPEVDDPRLRAVRRWGKPVVWLGNPWIGSRHWADGESEGEGGPAEGDRMASVEGDNEGGAAAVVRHLIALGHRRIGFIAGPPNDAAGRRREAGYRRALAEAGLSPDPDACATGDFTEAGGRRAALALLQRRPDLTALFAASDLMAIGALQALREHGRRVPEEISVAGFDGIYVGRYVVPVLTTAEQPIYALGTRAAALLLELIRGGRPAERVVVLPCRLRIGESTGPARG